MADDTTTTDDESMDLEKPSIVAEFVYFLKHEKKWWMGFIVFILALLTVFIFMTENQAVMPFIYTIF